MKSPLVAFIMAYLAFSNSLATATDAVDKRGIDLKDPDIVALIDSRMSSILSDVNSAHSSAATNLPPDLLSHAGLILPVETAPAERSRAPSNSAMHIAVLYGAVSFTIVWIMSK
jgi:hypothetical protein